MHAKAPSRLVPSLANATDLRTDKHWCLEVSLMILLYFVAALLCLSMHSVRNINVGWALIHLVIMYAKTCRRYKRFVKLGARMVSSNINNEMVRACMHGGYVYIVSISVCL